MVYLYLFAASSFSAASCVVHTVSTVAIIQIVNGTVSLHVCECMLCMCSYICAFEHTFIPKSFKALDTEIFSIARSMKCIPPFLCVCVSLFSHFHPVDFWQFSPVEIHSGSEIDWSAVARTYVAHTHTHSRYENASANRNWVCMYNNDGNQRMQTGSRLAHKITMRLSANNRTRTEDYG